MSAKETFFLIFITIWDYIFLYIGLDISLLLAVSERQIIFKFDKVVFKTNVVRFRFY